MGLLHPLLACLWLLLPGSIGCRFHTSFVAGNLKFTLGLVDIQKSINSQSLFVEEHIRPDWVMVLCELGSDLLCIPFY